MNDNVKDLNASHQKPQSFSREFCLQIFNALIQNEQELDVQLALDDRRDSREQNTAEEAFYNFCPNMSFSPIYVYNRVKNTIEIDRTDLSNRALIPITYFSWAGITLKDAINDIEAKFGENILKTVYGAIEKFGITSEMADYTSFDTVFYLPIEDAICNKLGIDYIDDRLLSTRVKIAFKWLEYQRNKGSY